MMIEIRRCDVCYKDYRSDDPLYLEFAVMELENGHRGDVCLACQANERKKESARARNADDARRGRTYY